jgi:2-keto-4-pentenoate hydratase/2-oxohepta-3-ene-1,7-dioic acid hydratase in catechol pathway
MKLATFESEGREKIGALVRADIVELSGDGLPATMIELIAGWSLFKDTAEAVARDGKSRQPLAKVRLLAPVPRPQKILAIGLNYADHIAESGAATPERQIWFSKLPNAVNGPFDPIEMPKASNAIDYEAELVFVIGKRCRHVTKDKARDAICRRSAAARALWRTQAAACAAGRPGGGAPVPLLL